MCRVKHILIMHARPHLYKPNTSRENTPFCIKLFTHYVKLGALLRLCRNCLLCVICIGFISFNLDYIYDSEIMILKFEIGIRIRYLNVESKLNESIGIRRVGLETRILSTEICFIIKIGKH